MQSLNTASQSSKKVCRLPQYLPLALTKDLNLNKWNGGLKNKDKLQYLAQRQYPDGYKITFVSQIQFQDRLSTLLFVSDRLGIVCPGIVNPFVLVAIVDS